MSESNDIHDMEMDLDLILLGPLTNSTKKTFKGWKSFHGLLHSWDDLKVLNSDFANVLKYEKFKKKYRFIIENEKTLLDNIDAYKSLKSHYKSHHKSVSKYTPSFKKEIIHHPPPSTVYDYNGYPLEITECIDLTETDNSQQSDGNITTTSSSDCPTILSSI
eukprot:77545_1